MQSYHMSSESIIKQVHCFVCIDCVKTAKLRRLDKRIGAHLKTIYNVKYTMFAYVNIG